MNTTRTTTILVDCSTTGGRGMAKQGYELVLELRRRGLDHLVCSDEGFAYKLRDLGIEPDILVPTALNRPPAEVIEAFETSLRDVNFKFLIKIGARMAGPRVAFMRKVPYVIVDAALPDRMDPTADSLYPEPVFQAADRYFLTTQFPWRYPNRFPSMANVEVVTYPLSRESRAELDALRTAPDAAIRERVAEFVPEVAAGGFAKSIALIVTGSYVGEISDRVTYGGWLTSRQHDQVIGFVRRCITDLGELARERIIVYMDRELLAAVSDLQQRYRDRLTLCTSRSARWSYREEFLVQRWADVLISRAANYQPFMAYLQRGGIVTSPVPSDGYMDEDAAAEQSAALGLTEFIPYADERYAEKLLAFMADPSRQRGISERLAVVQRDMFAAHDAIERILQVAAQRTG